MMKLNKILLYCCIVILLYCLSRQSVLAANNKVGIHILETTEAERAAELVNSQGGDWGYVTIVLREDDLDREKWQQFFNDCRQRHLIPIVRLATKPEASGCWRKPVDLDKWVDFLHSLNWPVKRQIVVIFNEPNHAREWGGEIDPAEYAWRLKEISRLFKKKNENFFILPAGLDQAADGRNGTMREEVFLREMIVAEPEIFSLIDGWNSHSYPNHGFIGRPDDIGRATVRGYNWETDLIKSLSALSSLSCLDNIYITETNWPSGKGYYNEETAADYFLQALEIWQADGRVKAVTPFVLNYPQPPFTQFSWLKEDGSPLEKYQRVLGVSKEKGEPEQVESYQVVEIGLGQILPTKQLVKGWVKIKNTGQWIMGEREDFTLPRNYFTIGSQGPQAIQPRRLDTLATSVKPGQEVTLEFTVETGTESAECQLDFDGQKYPVYVFKPFELKNEKVGIFQQLKSWLKFRVLKRN